MKRINFNAFSSETKSALKLIAVQGFFWFAWSFSSYASVYLQNNGFSSSQLGMLNSVSSTVAIFATMLWGIISDKINSIKKTFIIALVSSTIFFAITPFISPSLNIWAILMFIYYPFTNLFRCSVCTLLDNLTVRNCSEKRLNYGIIRALGSFTYTVGSIIVVSVIADVGVSNSFWISGLLTIPAIIFLFFSDDPKALTNTKKGEKIKVNPKELFKNYYYMTFMIFTAILYIPLCGEYSFITYFMEDVGVSNSNFAALLAVRAAMEIPFLALIVKLRKRFKLKHMIMAACVFMAIECIGNGLFVHDLPGVLIFGACFGLGNGLFIGTVSQYLYRLAPDHLKATAQTIYAAVTSVAGILGNLVGGFGYQLLGGRTFYILLGIIILVAVSFLALTFIFSKNRRNPADEKY